MKNKTKFLIASCLLAAFLLWTGLVKGIDTAAIGPQGTTVGFSTLNEAFHRLTGVHFSLYNLSDWLSILPLGIVFGFALLGLWQWIRRKSLFKVDQSIFVLGGFYLVVLFAFFFFEKVIINYRPVLIEGCLEASYPSSTTMLVMCVIPTAISQLNSRIKNGVLRRITAVSLAAFLLVMVALRLFSGVHWLTDILGGALLSAGLVTLYLAIVNIKNDP